MALPDTSLAAILDAMLEGFQVLGPGLRYLYLNDVAAQHGKTTKSALVGRTMAECYPGVERTPLYATLHRCLDERSSHVMENEFTFPDGSKGFFELRVEPVPQGICVLSIDITARKRAEAELALSEERLRHTQRMDAVGQLSAGIAHDFNNLLTVLIGHAELSLRRPDGPMREDVERVLEAARASADLTRQLMAYGRRSVVAREVLDPAEIVEALEPMLRHSLGERIELVFEAPRGLGRIEADRIQLQQVVMNLVLNARDAIEASGRISVGLALVTPDPASHPELSPGPHVVLSVADTGKGMDAATQARIFEPFFSTKEHSRGTGLGLATVYGIVRQHSGGIWVYSEPGAGSTFKVYLPVSQRDAAAAATAAEAPLAAEAPAGGGAVLVAEDSEFLRALVEAVLSSAGYRVLLAATGPEALATFDREREQIGLLITDVMMPGMTGPELIEQVRKRRATLPVICTSGYSDRQLAERGQLPEGIVFVEKPFAPHALLKHVQAVLGPASGAR